MIAVTGASGFLGRRVVAALRQRGHAVCAIVRDASRAPQEIDAVRVWDASDRGDAVEVLSGVTAIVHAAAYRPASLDDPGEAERCLMVNAAATARLLDAAVRASVRRFLYVGAGNIYRPLPRPATEDDPIWPGHRAAYYLGSKLCGELFVSAEAARGRIAAGTVRPSAIYGPKMPPGLVTTFLSRLRAGQPVTVADGGRYAADLVHVDDVASAMVDILDGDHTGTFNLGSGAATSALRLAEILCDALGCSHTLIVVEPERAGAPGFSALDIGRARAAFGYAPRGIEQGIADMIAAGGAS